MLSGLVFPAQGIFPDPGLNPGLLCLLYWQTPTTWEATWDEMLLYFTLPVFFPLAVFQTFLYFLLIGSNARQVLPYKFPMLNLVV